MLRFLQTKGRKNYDVLDAGAELTRGQVVAKNADGTVSSVTSGLGEYFVDAPKTYTGLYATANPGDVIGETIASGAKCVVVTPMIGERYATSMFTLPSVRVGYPLTVTSGKFVRATGGATYQWVYGGAYTDPTGSLAIVEKIASSTAPATRAVTYDKNGGAGTMTDADSPYYQGDKAIALANAFTSPEFKDFVDWDTAANGSGTNYDPADEITIGASNITLYAQYANSYTKLAFNANTGTGEMSDTTRYYVDDVIVVPECTFTPPEGYDFVGWNSSADGLGTDYAVEDEITVTTETIGAATTLYAIWEEHVGQS